MLRSALLPTALALAATLLPILPSQARDLPLWEGGIGLATVTLPDYRGSDETNTYVLPIPYVVYRGKFLKADRNGVRSTLFETDRVQLNISVNGTPPVRSNNNAARRGMADLKPIFEAGPVVNVNLWQTADEKMKLDFRAPLRASITAQMPPRHIGWLFSPNLNLDMRDVGGLTGWNLGLAGTTLFNDKKYNAYFYSVRPSEALPDRPAYDARGGYAGAQLTAALSKRFAHHWIGGFVRYDTLSHAVFEDSPLVKRHHSVLAGVAYIWVIGESSERVNVDEPLN